MTDKKRKIHIALAGLGVVGEGVYKLLLETQERLQFPWEIVIKKILVRDRLKKRDYDIPQNILVDSVDSLFVENDIDILVETMGGVDDAYHLVKSALASGIHVVSANKNLIDLFWDELHQLAKDHQVHLKYEAAVAGGIPLIDTLNRGLIASPLKGVYGILNGTVNYCLSRMEKEGLALDEIISDAQKEGYAEADPSADIQGHDTAHKICILSRLCYESTVNATEILVEGVDGIKPFDMDFLDRHDYTIKLLGLACRRHETIDIRVHPCFLAKDHPLAAVKGAYNAVVFESSVSGRTTLEGLGAGRFPTAGSVVADIVDVCATLSLPYFIPDYTEHKSVETQAVEDIESAYYLRLFVDDVPGMLSRVSERLAHHNVSIFKVAQDNIDNGQVVIFILTHMCRESIFQQLIQEIEKMEGVFEVPFSLRSAPWEKI